jgi:hypothetical protein
MRGIPDVVIQGELKEGHQRRVHQQLADPLQEGRATGRGVSIPGQGNIYVITARAPVRYKELRVPANEN